jgi:Protein tyrosine and serine/threonine kinase
MLPVKWMPPEAFLDGVFTTKTDVWFVKSVTCTSDTDLNLCHIRELERFSSPVSMLVTKICEGTLLKCNLQSFQLNSKVAYIRLLTV